MMKPIALLAVAALVSGCATLDQKEARCSCFKTDGSPSGNCDFAKLPVDPAVFSFAATRSSNTSTRLPSSNPQFGGAFDALTKPLSGVSPRRRVLTAVATGKLCDETS